MCFSVDYVHLKDYMLFCAHTLSTAYRGDEMNDSDELAKALCRLFAEISEKEKRKAIESNDYGTAFVAAVFEGLFNEAGHSFK